MNYLASVTQAKFPEILHFYKELGHVEAASKGKYNYCYLLFFLFFLLLFLCLLMLLSININY